MLECYDLTVEYQKNPVGISGNPGFSWKLDSDKENTFQTGYQIVVEDVWNSGRVDSNQSICVEYGGQPLQAKTHYTVRVKVWDNHGSESDWLYGYFETGLLHSQLWQARWLEPKNQNQVIPVFSKKFVVSGLVQRARVYATAYGLYEIYLNGVRLGDRLLTPGFTSYKKRLQYQTYEAESYLRDGENEMEIYLSGGWCTGRYPFQRGQNPYHMNPAVLAQLEISTEAGETIVATDSNWQCRESKLRFSQLYDGEIYDNSFTKIVPIPFQTPDLGYTNLIAQVNSPVRVIDRVRPKSIFTTPKGETVLDFGQNMAGWVEFKVCGKRGGRVCLSHAEVLDRDGNFYTDNLRTAKQKVEYILSGEGEEIWHARMSFQGFRYIRLDEYPAMPELEDFCGLVLCSDMRQTGSFSCSHHLLNRLYENVLWSQWGNFIDIPTDCPQRDERVGWTGDAQVFCKTAAQNMDTALFFKKWLGDMRADQTEEGATLIFVPSMNETLTSAGWGDAVTVCPWELYMAYGDIRVLREQYPAMKKWVEYIRAQGDNPYLWDTGFQLGDWLALDCPKGKKDGMTAKDFVASAYYARSCRILRDTAKLLKYQDDYETYCDLYKKIKEAFAQEFITPSGRLSESTQTAHAMALVFGLSTQPAKTAKRLATMVKENGDHLTTGFLGTPCILDALCENGYEEKAFDLLLQEEYPSWLYSVTQGATTIWEHWDGIKPDGSFRDPEMNSYNHYAYGAVADFLYKKIGGIIPVTPGYQKIRISPIPDKRITFAKASIDTVYGMVQVSWNSERNFVLQAEIPCNTCAEVCMPDGKIYQIGSGKYVFQAEK